MLSGIIVGGVGGSLLFYQDNIKYETQLNLLQSEIEEHQNTINNLNHVVETLNQDIETSQTAYQLLVQELDSYIIFRINIDVFVDNLMKPKAEYSWQEGYNNADIQALIVVRRADQYYDDIFFQIRDKMEAKGGAAVEGSRSHLGGYYTPVAYDLENGKYNDLIEHYGIDHVAILHLGGPFWSTLDGYSNYYTVYQKPLFPIISQLPVIALDRKSDSQFIFIVNKPQ